MQVMANHSEKNIADAVEMLKTAKAEAEFDLERGKQSGQPAQRVAA
jgi:glycine C-acetyltransferase